MRGDRKRNIFGYLALVPKGAFDDAEEPREDKTAGGAPRDAAGNNLHVRCAVLGAAKIEQRLGCRESPDHSNHGISNGAKVDIWTGGTHDVPRGRAAEQLDAQDQSIHDVASPAFGVLRSEVVPQFPAGRKNNPRIVGGERLAWRWRTPMQSRRAR